MKEKISFNIITNNTIIGAEGNTTASTYLNNDGRHIHILIDDVDAGNFELSIDIVTGRKTLYDLDRKEEVEIVEIRGE